MESKNDGNLHEGTWVVITAGTSRMIGRVVAIDGVVATNGKAADFDRETIVAANVIRLSHVLDFFTPLRPVQMKGPDGTPVVAMTRDKLLTGRDLTLHPYCVYIRNGPGVVFDFLDEMHTDDRRSYQTAIERAQKQIEADRMAASGLHLPGNAALSPMGHGRQ